MGILRLILKYEVWLLVGNQIFFNFFVTLIRELIVLTPGLNREQKRIPGSDSSAFPLALFPLTHPDAKLQSQMYPGGGSDSNPLCPSDIFPWQRGEKKNSPFYQRGLWGCNFPSPKIFSWLFKNDFYLWVRLLFSFY